MTIRCILSVLTNYKLICQLMFIFLSFALIKFYSCKINFFMLRSKVYRFSPMGPPTHYCLTLKALSGPLLRSQFSILESSNCKDLKALLGTIVEVLILENSYCWTQRALLCHCKMKILKIHHCLKCHIFESGKLNWSKYWDAIFNDSPFSTVNLENL